MTAPTRSWRATTGRRWRKCSSTSPAAGFRKARREQARQPPLGYRAASHQRDDPALLVSADVVVAAPAGIAVLAGAADHELRASAELHFAYVGVFRACRRQPDRRRDPVGHPVPRPARLLDLVSRG